MCSTVSVADSSISLETFQSCFPTIDCLFIPSCVSLCSLHKSFIYNIQSNAKCVVCGVILVNCRRYACTNLDINNAYLQLNISIDEVTITTFSSLCFTCYSVAKRKVVPVTRLEDVELSLESHKEMSHTRTALCMTCKEICKLCNSHEAFLLADMYDLFVSLLKLKCGEASCLESCKRSSRWLLSGIFEIFGDLIEVHKMSTRKYSTLLLYKDLNFRKALHLSCAKLRYHSKRSGDEMFSEDFKPTLNSERDINKMALYFLPHINRKLKHQSGEITKHYTQNLMETGSFNFDSLFDMIDPEVWNTVSLLTANNDELKYFSECGSLFGNGKLVFPSYSKPHGRQRRNRRIILIMVMQFTYNESNNYPFHIVIANCVKRLSHSSKLIKLLNQSGFCTSEDTLDRFLETIKQLRQQSGLLSTLESNTFTIVSVDNIDVLASSAAVTSQGLGRSWHGTSVMAQQPKPLTEKLSPTGELIDIIGQKSSPITSDFQTVQVYGDGRCLYRCIASYSNSNILLCKRNEVGIPVDQTMFHLEQQFADYFRYSVCQHLEQHLELLEELPEGIKQVLLESSNDQFYSSFSEKVADGRNSGTYAGHLEMCSLACVLRTDICVYQKTVHGLTLVARYPTKPMSMYHICLLYRPGSNAITSHFDLMYHGSCRPNCQLLLDTNDTTFNKWHDGVKGFGGLIKPNLLDFVSGSPQEAIQRTCDDRQLHPQASADGEETSSSSERYFTPSLIMDAPKKPSVRRKLSPSNLNVPEKGHFATPFFKTFIRQQLSVSTFFPSGEEKLQQKQLHYDMFMHISERYVSVVDVTKHTVPGLKCNMLLHSKARCEKSKFSYIYVLNEKADCAQTVKSVIGLLYDLFKISKSINHLVIAGDGATVKILLDVKKEYGEVLDWVIPYLGDWHVLKNFQEVVMKVFWDAGLKDIAKLTHKNSTLNNLKTCSNFKRTHRFLLQVYEAIYVHQFKCFLDCRDGKDESSISNEAFHKIVTNVVEQVHIQGDFCDYFDIEEFVSKVHMPLHGCLPTLLDEFNEFCIKMAEKYETFKFWNRFLKEDCFCYIQLWIAMRTGNWNLRLGALKEMGPLFHAFDRQNYSKMIPIHLSQMHGLPTYILDHFRNGAFVSSIRGFNFSSVGIDEAHEMLINKDCKMALSRSLPTNMEKISGTLEFQAQLLDNFQSQLSDSIFKPLQRDFAPSVIMSELQNVKAYFSKVSSCSMFSEDQAHTLYHPFEHTPASAVQQKALLSYREVGNSSYDTYVRFNILNETSTAKPVIRKHRLKTFAKDKVTKRTINYLEKEKKMITLCYKRTISFSEQHNQPIHQLFQFIETPRALCTPSGLPSKGAKYIMYNLFGKRYSQSFSPITENHTFPPGTCLIAEGMNIIYINPLPGFRCFAEYASLIVSRWVTPFFKKKYKEVRILFDQVCSQGISPKGFERERRDAGQDDDIEVFDSITDQTPLPQNWSKFLKVRTNKRKLCQYLSNKLIDIVSASFQTTDQKFVTSGGFLSNAPERTEWTGKCVTLAGISSHSIIHNHEESDTQIWLHVNDTSCSYVHVYSVDRDVGMIGLPLSFEGKIITIQYKASGTDDKYLNLNILRTALSRDSDLAPLVKHGCDVHKIMQMLYICTGCDFVSYFARLGKTTFLKVFLQFAEFISGSSSTQTDGQLCFDDVQFNHDRGLLSFYRLVGCVYFQANRASLNQHASNPVELFDSIQSSSIVDHHSKFLSIIRKASWQGVYEDTLLPSDTALSFHWLRSCWVSHVWGKSLQPIFNYPDLNLYGWEHILDSGEVTIKWDSTSNMERIRKNVLHLTRGCSCAKNKCSSRQCKCKKINEACGPGCTCRNCENLPVQSTPIVSVQDGEQTFSDDESVSSSISLIGDDHELDEDEVLTISRKGQEVQVVDNPFSDDSLSGEEF